MQPGASYAGKCHALRFATKENETLGSTALNGELFVLISRADRLLADLLSRGMPTASLFADEPIDYSSYPPSWAVFLLHSVVTAGCCHARMSDGMHDAYAVIRQGQLIVVWIDDFVDTCQLAVAALKAAILPAGTRPVSPLSLTASPDAAVPTHEDGLEGGRWLWWKNVRHGVPKGTVYRLLDFMWDSDSAAYDALIAADVFASVPAPQTIRSYGNKANNALPPGFPWRLATDSVSRQMTKEAVEANS
jgi:hypothetical protein